MREIVGEGVEIVEQEDTRHVAGLGSFGERVNGGLELQSKGRLRSR